VLTLSRVSKRFGDTVAVDDVSVRFARGRVHAVLGENGAGKTTLARIAFGLMRPDAGDVVLDGRHIHSVADAIENGVGMVHQHFSHVAAMTVAENVALGGKGAFSRRAATQRVVEIGERTGLTLDPHVVADRLPVGAQQRLEIVKALARDARLLILDEPTAVLAPNESDELLRWLRNFANAGNAIVLITHKLREALAIADDMTVLRRGRVVLAELATAVTLDSLSVALIGESSDRRESAPTTPPVGSVVASIARAAVAGEHGTRGVFDASLDIRAGEIVGVAGVEGAGARELLRLLAGRATASAGSATLPTTIGFVPEDRHRDGMILDYSATENIALRGAERRTGRLDWASLRVQTRNLVSKYDVRGGDDTSPVRSLSGGNQQKLVLARELDDHPPLVVAENPTRGLDIRATRDVHERLRRAARDGSAVVLYSSDLDEVLALASRVVVVHGGRVRETALDRESVGRAMLGLA
jgi:general nucleoside transport system ATP-binding protein